jgi:tetratricopeptide (TPR) repeat protein
MKKCLVFVIAFCLFVPALLGAQEEKKESPFQIYSKDQSQQNFINAYNEYNAQMKDTANYGAAAMVAWLNYFELEKNLDLLKENAASLTNMNKFQYANILLELGRYDEAILLYEQLNEKTPKWSCPWRHKGTALWKKGEYEEAVTALKKAIETRKEHYDAYIVLAQVYKDMKQYKKGVRTLEEGLTYYGKDIEDPEKELSNLDTQFLYLELLKKAGERTKYREQFDKLQKLAPDDERLKM